MKGKTKLINQNKIDFIEDFIKLIHYSEENELIASDAYDAGYRKCIVSDHDDDNMIQWLVDNIIKWPKRPSDKHIRGGWYWVSFFGNEMVAINVNTNKCVTKQDWLTSRGAIRNANQN